MSLRQSPVAGLSTRAFRSVRAGGTCAAHAVAPPDVALEQQQRGAARRLTPAPRAGPPPGPGRLAAGALEDAAATKACGATIRVYICHAWAQPVRAWRPSSPLLRRVPTYGRAQRVSSVGVRWSAAMLSLMISASCFLPVTALPAGSQWRLRRPKRAFFWLCGATTPPPLPHPKPFSASPSDIILENASHFHHLGAELLAHERSAATTSAAFLAVLIPREEAAAHSVACSHAAQRRSNRFGADRRAVF